MKLIQNRISIICLLITLMLLFTIPAIAALGGSTVKNTVHNLSTSGSGDITASGEDRICVFCHTPHNSNPAKPLWNHTLSGSTYTAYNSTTLDTTSSMGSLSGSTTKLCLSCHDGTIAIGDLAGMTVTMNDSSGTKLSNGKLVSSANLSADLSDDHPVLFEPDGTDAEINTSSEGVVLYDAEGYLECTSCHDPHDNTYDNFLVQDNSSGALCTTCHSKTGWSSGNAHYDVGLTCQDCHTPHNAGGSVLRAKSEEALCYTCHDDSGSRYSEWTASPPDVGSVIDTATGSVHPVEDPNLANRHDALENNTDGLVDSSNKHSECSDCHDPHQVTASNPLAGVPGIDLDGGPINSVANSYELCYKCHQGNTGLQDSVNSVKYVFDNRDFTHGYGATSSTTNNGNGTDTSARQCSTCHGGNGIDVDGSSTVAGGAVHGSSAPGLLTKPQLADLANPSTSDLCLSCHDLATSGTEPKVYSTQATTSQHNTKCTACHGDSVNYNAGINAGSKTGVPHGSNISSLLKNTQPELCATSGCHSSSDTTNSGGYNIPNSGHFIGVPLDITRSDGTTLTLEGEITNSDSAESSSDYNYDSGDSHYWHDEGSYNGGSSDRPITNTSGCRACHNSGVVDDKGDTDPSNNIIKVGYRGLHGSDNPNLLMLTIDKSDGTGCDDCHALPDGQVHSERDHNINNCQNCHVQSPHLNGQTGNGAGSLSEAQNNNITFTDNPIISVASPSYVRQFEDSTLGNYSTSNCVVDDNSDCSGRNHDGLSDSGGSYDGGGW